MKKKHYLLMAIIGVAFVAMASLSGFSQEDIAYVRDSAFGLRDRGPVAFVHDEHNEKAEIEDCNACHHVYEDGKLLEDETSEGMECSECHMTGGKTRMDLMRNYHLQCKGCHEDLGKGPVMCGECHK
ncbi:MAG: acidic cytochrome c3 [Desulfobacterales bacterium]|nr:MAG: acidic cytochrome c3 [Desulfobacterales bacterium]